MRKPRLDGLRVLAVDEDTKRVRLVREILANEGAAQVLAAHSAFQAIDILHTRDVDVALVELSDWEGSAAQFVKALRDPRQTPTPGLPVLTITPGKAKNEVRRIIGLGADHLIVRPFSTNSLIDRLRFVIDHPTEQYETSAYTGPDRRRVPDDLYYGHDRRSQSEEHRRQA